MRMPSPPIMLGGEGGCKKSQASLSWQDNAGCRRGESVYHPPHPLLAGMPSEPEYPSPESASHTPPHILPPGMHTG